MCPWPHGVLAEVVLSLWPAQPGRRGSARLAVRWLLNDPDQAARWRTGQADIREHVADDLHLLRYERLFSTLISDG
jgi:hypothetical protein